MSQAKNSRNVYGDPTLHLQSIPFMRAVGGTWIGGEPEHGHVHLPCTPAVCGGPTGAAVDQRAVAALLDQAGGVAVFAAANEVGATATLELRVDFVGEPLPGRGVHASAACTEIDGSSALVLGQAWCDGVTAPLARMTARFILGSGPGQGPKAPDRTNFAEAVQRLAGTVIPKVESFDELLGGCADGAVWRLPFEPWLVGAVLLPALHGGVVVAGLMTAARQVVPVNSGLRLASITVQFKRAGLANETRFAASVLKSGSRALFIDARATQENGHRGVAAIRCLYC